MNNLLEIFLEECEDNFDSWEEACVDLCESENVELMNQLFRAVHNLKGSSASVGLTDFSKKLHLIEDIIDLVRNKKIPFNTDLFGKLIDLSELFREWAKSSPLEEASSILTKEIDQFREKYANTSNDDSNEKAPTSGFVLFDDEPEDTPVKSAEEEPQNEQIQPTSQPEATDNKPTISSSSNKSLRIRQRDLDFIFEIANELTISKEILKKMSSEDGSPDFLNLSSNIEHLVEQLQGTIITIKNQPIAPLLRYLKKTALDTAKKTNKEITVLLEGENVRVNKALNETLKDPLMHLVRNSVDHGIEEDREKASKPKKGQLVIKVTSGNRFLEISISDDGQGLDTEKVLKKAIEKGIADKNKTYTKSEIINYIFSAGFSTNEVATNISGRGVGMDVVNTTLKELGGTIRIESERGKGSEFIITLPSNNTIYDVFNIEVGGDVFAIDKKEVNEIIQVKSDDIKIVSDLQRYITYKSINFPIVNLSDHINKSTACSLSTKKQRFFILVNRKNTEVAVEIDKVLSEQQLVVSEVNKHLKNLEHISGYSTLPSGEPCLILNLNEFLDQVSFE